jgi:hypothetical protein
MIACTIRERWKTMIESVNAAGRDGDVVLALSGFTAGAGKDLWHRTGLLKRMRKADDGASIRPTKRTRVVVAQAGTVDGKQAAEALADPSTSPHAVLDLVPPPSSPLLDLVSKIALTSTAALLVYGIGLGVAAPAGARVASMFYAGDLYGTGFDAIRKVIEEPAFQVPKVIDDETIAKSKAFVTRLKEVRHELSQ